MEVYNSPYLIIKHEQEHSRLINIWKFSPTDDVTYRNELIEHLHIVEKIKPSQVIWLLENLTFKVSEVTKIWVDENISKPIYRGGFIARRQDGFDQVAFVVGHDVLAYIEVMDIFNEHSASGFKPKYFATEIDAENWLNETLNIKVSKSEEEKLSITSDYSVFPNPAVDIININAPDNLNYEATIFDLQGRLIMSTTNQSVIDVKTLPQEMYLIVIKDLDSGQKVIEKIIKR